MAKIIQSDLKLYKYDELKVKFSSQLKIHSKKECFVRARYFLLLQVIIFLFIY